MAEHKQTARQAWAEMSGANEFIKFGDQLSSVLSPLLPPPINQKTMMDKNAHITPVGRLSLTTAEMPQIINPPKPSTQSPDMIMRRTPKPPLRAPTNERRQVLTGGI